MNAKMKHKRSACDVNANIGEFEVLTLTVAAPILLCHGICNTRYVQNK